MPAPGPGAPEGPAAFDPLEVMRRAAEAARGDEGPPELVRTPRPGLPVAGCLRRLALVLLVLFLLAIAAVWFLTGGAVREFVTDLGQSAGVMGGVPQQTLRGIEAYRRGDLALAERELDKAARSHRRSALALLYLARIRIDSNDPDGAAAFLDEAVLREPENAIAHRMLGENHLMRAQHPVVPRDHLYTTSELAAAEEHLSRAIELNPADRRAHGYRACVLSASGRTADASAERAAAGPGPWAACDPSNTPP
jgi:tetratricopeptide (TPR) repeat protein